MQRALRQKQRLARPIRNIGRRACACKGHCDRIPLQQEQRNSRVGELVRAKGTATIRVFEINLLCFSRRACACKGHCDNSEFSFSMVTRM